MGAPVKNGMHYICYLLSTLFLPLVICSPSAGKRSASAINQNAESLAFQVSLEVDPSLPSRLQTNLKLDGLADLGPHLDLKAFDGVEFPDTFEGRYNAFKFVYEMTRFHLRSSPCYNDLMKIAYNAAATLAQEDPEAFRSQRHHLSCFEAFLHLSRHENMNGFLNLVLTSAASTPIKCNDPQTIPSDFIPRVREFFSRGDNSKFFWIIFDEHEPFFGFFIATCWELKYKDIMLNWWRRHDYKNFIENINFMIVENYSSLITDRRSFARILNDYIDCAWKYYFPHDNRFPFNYGQDNRSPEDYRQKGSALFSTEQSIVAYCYATEIPPEHLDEDQFDGELIGQMMPFALISAGCFEQALQYIPQDTTSQEHHCIVSFVWTNSGFCSFLSERDPEWIRKHLKPESETGKDVLNSNRQAFCAFYKISSLGEYWNLYQWPIPEFFSDSEIYDFIVSLDDKQLSTCFAQVFNPTILQRSATRFVETLKIFLLVWDQKKRMISGDSGISVTITDSQLLAIIKHGDSSLIHALNNCSFNVSVEFTALKSPQLPSLTITVCQVLGLDPQPYFRQQLIREIATVRGHQSLLNGPYLPIFICRLLQLKNYLNAESHAILSAELNGLVFETPGFLDTVHQALLLPVT